MGSFPVCRSGGITSRSLSVVGYGLSVRLHLHLCVINSIIFLFRIFYLGEIYNFKYHDSFKVSVDSFTPNQSIAHTKVGVRKHPMTLRRRAPKTTSKNLHNEPTNSLHLLRGCRVVLEDVCFKNFNLVSGCTKSSKMNTLVDKFNCKVLLVDIRDHTSFHNTDLPNELKSLQKTCGDGRTSRFTRCKSSMCNFQILSGRFRGFFRYPAQIPAHSPYQQWIYQLPLI